MRVCPLIVAKADTRLVLPTPGLPSNNKGRPNCNPLRRRNKLEEGP